MRIESLVATGPLTARFFLGLFFVIALARIVLGMSFLCFGHSDSFLLLDSFSVSLSLIGAGKLPLLAFPILFIGQLTAPSAGCLATSIGRIAIKVMNRMKMTIAPFEQAGTRRS